MALTTCRKDFLQNGGKIACWHKHDCKYLKAGWCHFHHASSADDYWQDGGGKECAQFFRRHDGHCDSNDFKQSIEAKIKDATDALLELSNALASQGSILDELQKWQSNVSIDFSKLPSAIQDITILRQRVDVIADQAGQPQRAPPGLDDDHLNQIMDIGKDVTRLKSQHQHMQELMRHPTVANKAKQHPDVKALTKRLGELERLTTGYRDVTALQQQLQDLTSRTVVIETATANAAAAHPDGDDEGPHRGFVEKLQINEVTVEQLERLCMHSIDADTQWRETTSRMRSLAAQLEAHEGKLQELQNRLGTNIANRGKDHVAAKQDKWQSVQAEHEQRLTTFADKFEGVQAAIQLLTQSRDAHKDLINDLQDTLRSANTNDFLKSLIPYKTTHRRHYQHCSRSNFLSRASCRPSLHGWG